MTKIIVTKLDLDDILDIVHELKAIGYLLDEDFSFAYFSTFNELNSSNYVEFTFFNESLASMFVLKWGEHI